MNWRLSRSIALAAVALMATSALQAQHRGGYLARKGMWWGIGAGYGSMGISCSFCGTDRETGLSGMFGIGGTMSPHLVLGLETNGFYKTDNGIDIVDGQAGLSGHYYPSPTGNVFIRGSVGVSHLSLDDGTDKVTATGVGVGLGVGYDLYIGRTVSITPYFNYLLALSGNGKANGVDSGEKVHPNLWQVGASLMFH